ncbi:TPA: hypothetical protein ACW7KA_004533 [Citrobacter freundii]|uniref:hypothetical protein n=1 Tax=Citrobacter freundii TaxID=546 RepID=UPI0014613EB9|nr:hypothetical protein [Citrobacter freundii]MBJ8719821.1 hypothetical protein [Citrobacter freundii]MBJ9566919.1 hypothetical protein [Citrobacter freundii]NMR04932.1 hypothetical protein [Citrobacter freundii]HAT3456194.1 hypothetical protein [Citrobacter freundii]
MPVLKQSLKWSPDGCRVETILAGEHEELPVRAIEIAAQLGILGVDTENEQEIITEQPEQPEQPAPEKTDKKAKK